MSRIIRVAILDDHQSIIDGYLYRLKDMPQIEVVGTASFGGELEPMLANQPVDVVLLDVSVPISADNPNPYPILSEIPKLLQKYPDLVLVVISMHTGRALVKAVMEAGASGCLLKDDREMIKRLGEAVLTVANGGVVWSQQAYRQLKASESDPAESTLTSRQREALSICAAYPECTTAEIADLLGVANSTARNLLSNAYVKLEVRTRTAALLKASQLGLITLLMSPPPSGK